MNVPGVDLPHQSICVTCLSRDRKLFTVNDSKLYASIMLNLSENDTLCWECHFFVRKVAAFRSRAARAQALLAAALHQTNEMETNSLSSLMVAPKLQEINLEPHYLLHVNVKTETLNETCTSTYEYPTEDTPNNDDDILCGESFEKIGDSPLLPGLNEQTEAKCDEEACTDMIDDHITDASSLNDLLLERQYLSELEPDFASEYSEKSAEDKSAGSQTLEKQFGLKSCTVVLEAIPPASLISNKTPITDCNIKNKEINAQANHRKNDKNKKSRPTQTHDVRKPYTCNTCGRQFRIQSRLNRHIVTHKGEKPFSCSLCETRFTLKGSLTKHLRRHGVIPPYKKPKQKSLICDTCGKQFKKLSKFKMHVMIHTGEKPFICDVCGKRCCQKGAMITHLRTHLSEKPCFISPKPTPLRTKTFGCNTCGRRFHSKAILGRHCLIHRGEKPFVCELCGKQFRQQGVLTAHLRAHSGEKPFSCQICDKRLMSKQSLTLHVAKHSVPVNCFTCEICGKSFSVRHALVMHLKRHEPSKSKPFGCVACDRQFGARSALNRHVRVVHECVKKFGCDVCKKWFKVKTHLKDHMRTHTGERPFSCGLCDFRFKRKCHLVKHMAVHTGVKPFCCDVCDKRFAQKNNLSAHIRLHTRKK